jgi:WD40 repeat protein
MSATARTFHLADGSPGAALEHAAGLKARGMGKGLLPVLALAFHPSDPIVLTGCADRTARLWDVRDGRELLRLQHQGPVLSTAVSGDGRFVATGSGLVEKGACVFDARSGERLRVIPHSGDVLDVCFGAGGSELVTVCGDGWVRLWDAGSNEPRLVWSVQHAAKVRALASHPGGHFYVTAGDDWTARVWSPADGRELARVSAASVIVAVAVSQDGRRIATAAGTTAQVWDVMYSAPGGDAGRPLTAQMS